MKVSLILGINGQDGSLLAKELLESGGSVWGGFRRGSETGSSLQTWRLDELGIRDDVKLLPFDLNDYISIQKILKLFLLNPQILCNYLNDLAKLQ
jgi:GDPmannose 4,6-dehydratase